MDRRNHPRTDISVYLCVEAPGFVTEGIARDISTRGSFVELTQMCPCTELREVRLHFAIDTGAQVLSRHITGKVLRNEGTGLAISFAENDILGRAVVHELMYYLQLSRGETLPDAGCTHDHTQWSSQHHAA